MVCTIRTTNFGFSHRMGIGIKGRQRGESKRRLTQWQGSVEGGHATRLVGLVQRRRTRSRSRGFNLKKGEIGKREERKKEGRLRETGLFILAPRQTRRIASTYYDGNVGV